MKKLRGTAIEVVNWEMSRRHVRYALFDFDGTLSLIREGWQDVMVPMMVDTIRTETETAESEDDLRRYVREYVYRLTGKQTIYQMFQLAEEVERRGGTPHEPLHYKREYHRRLDQRIEGRIARLASGATEPDDLMVPGARAMLKGIRERGVPCFLASGTDEEFVRAEADALRISSFFEEIFGAQDDYLRFSKAMVIGNLIDRRRLSGEELLVVGDGYVEIANAREVGAVAVGVASNEARRTGLDKWKRRRLIDAGADVIVPDFREHLPLLRYLFAEDEDALPTV